MEQFNKHAHHLYTHHYPKPLYSKSGAVSQVEKETTQQKKPQSMQKGINFFCGAMQTINYSYKITNISNAERSFIAHF